MVCSVAFTSDGKMLASGSFDSTSKLWDVGNGNLIRTLQGHTSTVFSVAFSPDGKTLASGSDDHAIKLWDAGSGNPIRTLQGHTNRVFSVAFSPDGKTLASGSHDKTIKLWDVSNGNLIRALQVYGGLAFSPDGKTLASGGDDAIKLWDVSNGNLIRTLQGNTDGVSMAFSPDGKMLASGSSDATTGIWSTETDKLLVRLICLADDAWIAYTSDGYFSCPEGALKYITWRIDNQIYDNSKFKSRFYKQHDLVSSQLRGK